MAALEAVKVVSHFSQFFSSAQCVLNGPCAVARDIAASIAQCFFNLRNFSIMPVCKAIPEKDGVYVITFTCTNWLPYLRSVMPIIVFTIGSITLKRRATILLV